MKHFFTALLLAQLFLIPFAQADFSDITDNRYADTIQYLQEKEVIQGYENGDFLPGQAITRAEFLKMLLADYKIDPSTIENRSYPYKDVPNDSWFAPYVQRAYEIGLLPNKSEFNPNENLTRVEGVQMILNLMGIPVPRLMHEEEWSLNYRDVRFDAWYAPTVYYGEIYDLISPLDPEDPEYFRPLKKLTRGEATELLYRMDVFLYGSQLANDFAELENQLFGEEITYDIPHLDIFLDVWNRLHTSYYESDNLDEDELIYSAMEGMIDSLDDKYSNFMSPSEALSFTSYLEGELVGIGAQLTENDEGQVVIHSFISGGPAENSGLHINDRIMAIDGVDVTASPIGDITNLIRGEADTSVTITVQRRNQTELIDITITRAVVDVGYLSGKMIGDAIYVDINLFDSLSFIDFTQIIQPLIEANPDFEGFIFDLRDNPGGYLDSLESMLGHFIPYGHPLAYLIYGDNHAAFHMSQGKGEWAGHPIVILINEESASASEIMALVLKEENNAVLVGKTSYGKGTVQEIIRYVGGSSLKMTVAEWRSPNFHSINGIGISPHYEVDLTLNDLEAGKDPQLETAITALHQEAAELAAEQTNEETEK